MTETLGHLLSGDTRLAWRRVEGEGPTLIWFGGFRSEMTGTKAEALAAWARARGRDFLRFDYFGHGASDGDFEAGAISNSPAIRSDDLVFTLIRDGDHRLSRPADLARLAGCADELTGTS